MAKSMEINIVVEYPSGRFGTGGTDISVKEEIMSKVGIMNPHIRIFSIGGDPHKNTLW